MAIQPSPRTWGFSTDLRARLPLVVLFWSTCWLLTGCGSGKRSYQQFMLGQDPAIPSHSAIQAPMVNPYDLSEQSSDETFEQFFRTRRAGEIWLTLLHYVSPDTFGNLIDEKTISKGHIMRHLLSQHPTRMQDQLKVGIEVYVQRLNQEAAYKKFLEHNGLDAVWESLDQARGQYKLDLKWMLLSCDSAVRSHVLEGIVQFILNHCPKLLELDLSGNGLTTLPETFVNLTQLVNLDLSANQLTVLPASFRNLTKLRWFTGYDLNETALQDLTAILFQDFLEHAGLYAVWQRLDQARFETSLDLSGMLPTCGPALQSQVLERMVPFMLNHCPKLVELNLSDNSLKVLPDSLGELTQLQKLDLSNNELEVLPESFGNLTQLDVLYLQNNQLSALPESFGNLTQLSVLWLEDNELEVLPATFGSLINLEMLDLDNNELKALPNSFGNFKRLNDLNLNSNNLTTLPDTFGSLTQLERLFLSRNGLQALPDTFGNLCQLNELNLDYNKLTTLPVSFQNLTKLGAFAVYNNPLLDPNADLGGVYVLLTNHNMQYNPLSPNVYQQEKINKGTYDLVINRDICQVTLPICPKYIQCDQSCSAIVLIRQLGKVTLPHPVPLYLSSWREVVEQRYSGANVFLINETINPETRQ